MSIGSVVRMAIINDSLVPSIDHPAAAGLWFVVLVGGWLAAGGDEVVGEADWSLGLMTILWGRPKPSVLPGGICRRWKRGMNLLECVRW